MSDAGARHVVPLENSGADTSPIPAAVLWQLDIVLALRAEVSSYTALNFTDTTAACACVCLCVCVCVCVSDSAPCQLLQQSEPGGGPVTPFTGLASHAAIVSIWLCAK